MGEPRGVIRVICWYWKQTGYRKKFTAEHVNTLANMVARNLTLPHEFVCITDMPQGIQCRTVPLPKVEMEWPVGRPNCFRRLWAFGDEAKELLGPRIASLDLDCVVTGSLDKLLGRKEDFIIWRDPNGKQYNGSFWLHTAGTRTKVWKDFNGQASLAQMRGRSGSDQGWLSARLPNEATWTQKDGVLSYKRDVRRAGSLPPGTRVVFFHGKPDPWEEAPRVPWIREHYR